MIPFIVMLTAFIFIFVLNCEKNGVILSLIKGLSLNLFKKYIFNDRVCENWVVLLLLLIIIITIIITVLLYVILQTLIHKRLWKWPHTVRNVAILSIIILQEKHSWKANVRILPLCKPNLNECPCNNVNTRFEWIGIEMYTNHIPPYYLWIYFCFNCCT